MEYIEYILAYVRLARISESILFCEIGAVTKYLIFGIWLPPTSQKESYFISFLEPQVQRHVHKLHTFVHPILCGGYTLCAHKRDKNFRLGAPAAKALQVLTMDVRGSSIQKIALRICKRQ